MENAPSSRCISYWNCGFLHSHVLVYQCVTSDGISWSHWLLPIWTSQASRLPPLTSCSLRDISTASSSTHSPRFRLIPYRARLDTEEGMGVATNRPLQSFWCMLHAWTENLYCVCIYVCVCNETYTVHIIKHESWTLPNTGGDQWFGDLPMSTMQSHLSLLPCCLVACIVLRALRVMKFPFT